MASYGQREVFSNAPLEFVACEIRVPITPRLVREDTFELLTDALSSQFPLPDQEQVQTLTFLAGRAGVPETDRRFRFLNLDRTASAVVSRNAITVETTNYGEFPAFRALVLFVVEAVSRVAKIVGIERIGLRYIDEIRVPDNPGDVAGWRGWIADEVLGPLDIAGDYRPTEFQTVLRLTAGDTNVVVRYGALTGEGVVGDGPLKRRSRRATGPFFVIDTDCFQVTQGADMTEFAVEPITAVLDELHRPAGTLFRRATTDRLREEFRRTP